MTLELGPFPEAVNGNEVKKLMIYFNVTGDKEGGKVNLDNLSVELKAAARTSAKSILKNGSFEQVPSCTTTRSRSAVGI